MPVSKPRKKPSRPTASRPRASVQPIPSTSSPQQVAVGLVTNTARVLMEHVRLFENLAADHEDLDGLDDARMKLRVAALAIVDATDALNNRPMTYETMRAGPPAYD